MQFLLGHNHFVVARGNKAVTPAEYWNMHWHVVGDLPWPRQEAAQHVDSDSNLTIEGSAR